MTATFLNRLPELAMAIAMALSLATPASAQETALFDIAPGPLDRALSSFGEASGVTVLYDADLAEGHRSTGVSGEMTRDAALGELLVGTGLRFRRSGTGAVTLERIGAEPGAIAGGGIGEGTVILNEITVTARRFEETLQDVPGSVKVLSRDAIERSNLRNIDDLIPAIANLNVTDNGSIGAANLSIRGISAINGTTGPVVGVYLDDAILNPLAGSTAIAPELLDLERIEVLYGPQGTTFGRGTIGGAINYITRKPTSDFEARVSGELGSFPDGEVKALVGGALLPDDLLNARVSAFGRYSDGFIEAGDFDTPFGQFNSTDLNDLSSYGGRIALRSEPVEGLTLDWSGSFDRQNEDFRQGVSLSELERGNFISTANRTGEGQLDNFYTALRAEYAGAAGTFISNTAYVRSDNDLIGLDGDFLPADLSTVDFVEDLRSVSQEFRFESKSYDLPVLGQSEVLIGANFTFAKENDFFEISPLPLGEGLGLQGSSAATTNEIFDLGLFADARFRPTDTLEIGAGLRFSRVAVDFAGDGTGSFFGQGGAEFLTASDTFSAVTPRGSARYDATADLSTYVSVSTGLLAGGFNTFSDFLGQPFEEERAINFVGGVRST
ncbi:MAG: TonB-dependent receptor, partial [Pseudomonadota bacterium]